MDAVQFPATSEGDVVGHGYPRMGEWYSFEGESTDALGEWSQREV